MIGKKNMKLLIVIPAYNESESIERVVDNLILNYREFNYVVINDGSKDDTAEICKKRKYNLINLPVNLGLAGAFEAGMKYAERLGYDMVLQFDGDGQHSPLYIRNLMDEMISGNYDIVIGSRFKREKKPKSLRMLGSRVIQWIIRLSTGEIIMDPTSGMRMFNREMITEFAKNINYGPEPDTISYLIKNGAKISEVQVSMEERLAGESYLTFAKSLTYMIRMSISIACIQIFRTRR